MDIFSTRELATAFWVGAILIAVGMAIVTNKKIRQGFIGVLKCFFNRKLRKLWEIYFLYIGIITLMFSRSPIWKNIYLKDIILWTLFSGLTICMNAVAGEADEKYISKVLKDNIRFTVVTEFLLSTFTFSFWVELIIIPITTVIVLFDTVAEHKSDAIAVHKLLQDMMAFAGLCVILQTVRVGILEYRELNVINTLVSFFIPIVYLLLVTPLEYAFERNRQISRRIKKHLWLSNRSWARDVHSFGILHSWGALAGKSCSAQASSIWLIAGAFRRTQSK